jgi:hypothetical protein
VQIRAYMAGCDNWKPEDDKLRLQCISTNGRDLRCAAKELSIRVTALDTRVPRSDASLELSIHL